MYVYVYKKIMIIIRNNIYHHSSYHIIISLPMIMNKSKILVDSHLNTTIGSRTGARILIPLPKNRCCYIGERSTKTIHYSCMKGRVDFDRFECFFKANPIRNKYKNMYTIGIENI